jgi:hypothetical protein
MMSNKQLKKPRNNEQQTSSKQSEEQLPFKILPARRFFVSMSTGTPRRQPGRKNISQISLALLSVGFVR